eukprot:6974865-Ditylum_brightwellii.AAC.1
MNSKRKNQKYLLYVLSRQRVRSFQKYAVTLAGFQRVKHTNVSCGLIYYQKVVYASENAWTDFCHMNFNSPPILNNMGKQSLYVLIAVEGVKDIEDLALTGPSRKNEDGYVLLLTTTHDSIKDQSRLPSDLIKDLHQAKHNIIKKRQRYFQLSKEVFSFGIGARYYTTNDVSLGKYSSKSIKLEIKTKTFDSTFEQIY